MIPDSGQASRLGFERLDLLRTTATQMMDQARLVEAEAILRGVLDRSPDDVRALMALATLRERIGDVEDSVAIFDRAFALAPTTPALVSAAIFSHDRRPEATLEDGYRWRRRFNDLVKQPIRAHQNDRAPDRRLRVGYVSGDFRHHSASVVFAAILLHHDPAQFEVFAYSTFRASDWMADTFRAAIPNWRDIEGWPDDAIDAKIREDRIDVLVDLSGHSAGNRLTVFARKPAPVQVTAWGYITGTGLDAMDYLFADEDTIYPDEEQWYAEEIVRLPRIVSFAPASPDVCGPVGPLPALRNGHLTYGVVNRLGKLKQGAIDLWGRILRAVPDARLIVKAPGLDDAATREVLARRFADAGADLGRLEFRGGTGFNEHIRVYNEIDVCLDPWPDGGGVSTLEACWMGVPTVTLPYRQIASRLTTSFNRELGLPFLIASSADEYVERAVQLNDQREEVARVRSLLRDVISCSALCDSLGYAKATENAYREFWRRYCREQDRPPLPATPPQMTLVAS